MRKIGITATARRLALLTATSAALSFTVAGGVADANPGIRTIGPGPSSNTAGVHCIQDALHVIPDDGKYGQQTYTAVKQFQLSHGLRMDGAVGEATGDLLLPSAPDGCIDHVPSTYSTPQWVSTPRPGRKLSSAELKAKADKIMEMDYLTFMKTKESDPDRSFDWNSNGCNDFAPFTPVYKDLFMRPCNQHDFGYRNYGGHAPGGLHLGPDEATRAWIDGRLYEEITRLCYRNFGALSQTYNLIACNGEASHVYAAVRNGGRSHF
jgi:peptidoglycan hydrolase-like protein with peptidoglycan-binding domain